MCCLTKDELSRHLNKASDRTVKFWRRFTLSFWLLWIFVVIKLAFWIEFWSQFERPVRQKPPNNSILIWRETWREKDKPDQYSEAEQFLLNMPLSWKEPLITEIILVGQEDKCYNPAFAREWPGTTEYKIKDKMRRLTDQDEEEFFSPRKLQDLLTAEEEASELLAQYDSDGDGRFNEEEVAEMITDSQIPLQDNNETEVGGDNDDAKQPEKKLEWVTVQNGKVSGLSSQKISSIDGVSMCLYANVFS